MRAWMRTNQARRIVIILEVTIAVGGIGAKVLYDRVVHGNDAKMHVKETSRGLREQKGSQQRSTS
jgi:hypothetical protein